MTRLPRAVLRGAARAAVAVAVAALAPAHAATAAPPELFAPGVVSGPAHDSAPAFSPDGRELYFTRSSSSVSTILVSRRLAHGWSEPEIAPFSGEWLEMEPAFAPDGSFLVYASNRPDDGGGAPIDGFFNGVARPGKGARLWRVDRLPTAWSRPRLLPPAINDGHAIYAPSIVGDGSLYFMKPGAGGRFEVFRSQAEANGFGPAVRQSFNADGAASVDPAVAPDESFVVFSSNRKPARGMALFIALRTPAGWGCALPLAGTAGNGTSDAEARLSPDAKTLYFASDRTVGLAFPATRQQTAAALRRMRDWDNGNYNIWSIDLARWLVGTDDAGGCAS